jgi:hypothetical protein
MLAHSLKVINMRLIFFIFLILFISCSRDKTPISFSTNTTPDSTDVPSDSTYSPPDSTNVPPDSSNTPSDSSNTKLMYFPLKVGNTWYYDSPSSPYPGSINPASIRMIRSSFVKNDTTYFVWTRGEYLNKVGDQDIDTIRTDDQGNIWLLKNNIEYLWFDFSLDDGSTYTSTYTIQDIWTGFEWLGADYYYTVYVHKNISSQLYSNTYNNCIKLIFNIVNLDIGDEGYYTFAPGVGLIQYGSAEQWNLQRLLRSTIY